MNAFLAKSGAAVTFHSGAGSVTGANFLLENGDKKILIDCGLIQGESVAQEENRQDFAYDISSITALVITHAHLDHVGRIAKLVKEGYKGPIYSTPETRDLAEVVLRDAVGILAMEARQQGKEALYELPDVDAIFPLWQTFPYHQEKKIGNVTINLKDAGHILGSAMVEVVVSSGKKVLFSGDLGNSPHVLLRDAEPIGDADYVVIESVYGDRNHEPADMRSKNFEKIIKDTISRGGTLVIPAFAIDRTQIILYELNRLVEQNLIPKIPVFVDSPMATRATEIYRSSSVLFNDHAKELIAKGDDIFHFPRLEFTMSGNDSRAIEQVKGPKIILAGSGMSVGGRVIGHEEHYLTDARNTLLLVGYQSVGSLGRQLADGVKKITIHGNKVNVKAQVETIFGYSAHRDSDHLVQFVGEAGDKLKEVFVVMGEPKSSMHLAQRINDEFGGRIKAVVPEKGRTYNIM